MKAMRLLPRRKSNDEKERIDAGQEGELYKVKMYNRDEKPLQSRNHHADLEHRRRNSTSDMNMRAPPSTSALEPLTPLGLNQPPDWTRNINMEHLEQELDLELPPPPPLSTGLKSRSTTKSRENNNSNPGRRSPTTRLEVRRRSPMPNRQRSDRKRESLSPTTPSKPSSGRERRNTIPKGLNRHPSARSRRSISPKNPTTSKSGSTRDLLPESDERRHRDQRMSTKDPKRKLRKEHSFSKASNRSNDHSTARRNSTASRNAPIAKESRRSSFDHHQISNEKQWHSRRGSAESIDEGARNFYKQERRTSRRDSGGSADSIDEGKRNFHKLERRTSRRDSGGSTDSIDEGARNLHKPERRTSRRDNAGYQDGKSTRNVRQQGVAQVTLENQSPILIPEEDPSIYSKSVGASDCATCVPKEKRKSESNERQPRTEKSELFEMNYREKGENEQNRRSNRRDNEPPEFEIRFKGKGDNEHNQHKSEPILEPSKKEVHQENTDISHSDNSTLYSGYSKSVADSDCATCRTSIPEAIHENTGIFGSDDNSLSAINLAVNVKNYPPTIHVNSPRRVGLELEKRKIG